MTQYFIRRLLKAQRCLEGVEVVQGVLKSVEWFELGQAKFRQHWAFQDCRSKRQVCRPDHSSQTSICLPFNGIPELVHLLSHLLEKILVWFIWGRSSLTVASSISVSLIFLIEPRPVLLLLKLQPHLLILSSELFNASCKCLYLQGQCCKVLVGLHLNLGIDWKLRFRT